MDYQKILGQRIRNFRKRAGLSQMELEGEIGASAGYLSRVENGEINPTKETIVTIAEKLELNDKEIDYLYGKLFYPATKEEIGRAVKQVTNYLESENVMGYLLDDRNRVWAASKTFQKILHLSDSELQALTGKGLTDIMLDPNSHALDIVADEDLEEILFRVLKRLYAEMGFMQDDEIYIRTVEIIKSHKLANSLWEKVLKMDRIGLQTADENKVIFTINGLKVPLTYTVNTLLDQRRFDLIEYHHTNVLYKVLSKVL